ncbi:class I SAM-dependent methyltransferase [Solirubrobacter phytolaccae]|uniref:Class I SAM-dependent methyltransferase n=1 Tax=Solirubrobacter phytolaccae TaxID=1404360 RepID=A0A9X3NE58_9ACTN|nr:class I SAM-dependent methyltransferase [Solirubrobacter phytolaccae]MDA0183285.1 class I SAM-dependent methyltransferase [Solirubrobacter phytolaccae]
MSRQHGNRAATRSEIVDRTGGSGRYDALYEAGAGALLWPATPGRMVRLAAELAPPGTALDIGCGDGKNLLYLEQHGWTVDGMDVSRTALELTHARLRDAAHEHRGGLTCADVTSWKPEATYDLVVCYGLIHCLDDGEVALLSRRIQQTLRPGGLLAFAAFNDDLPVPPGHATGPLVLRSRRSLLSLYPGWHRHAVIHGFISEDHLPLVGPHRHSLTWMLLEKP